MKVLRFAVIAPFLIFGGIGVAQASDLTVTYGTPQTNGTTVERFNEFTPAAPGTSNESNSQSLVLTHLGNAALQLTDAQIVQGSLSGEYAAPYSVSHGAQSTTPFVAIYNGGTADFTLSQPTNYFGIEWGSVDPSNTLTFEGQNGNVIGTVSGADVMNSVGGVTSGSWTSDGTVYANILSSVPIYQVIVGTGQNSFEFDNVRVAPTPLPAALPMFGAVVAGLGAFGWWSKRRRNLSA